VRLSNADIYELPVMVALLKVLSIRPPDKKGFDAAECDFRILGEHIDIGRLNFRGDAVTLNGAGEVDWQKRLNLQFYTMVGRDSLQVPILRPLLGEASRQIMTIQVAGTVDQPLVSRKALPVVEKGLQEIFGDTKQR
jgi:hypothetical protein